MVSLVSLVDLVSSEDVEKAIPAFQAENTSDTIPFAFAADFQDSNAVVKVSVEEAACPTPAFQAENMSARVPSSLDCVFQASKAVDNADIFFVYDGPTLLEEIIAASKSTRIDLKIIIVIIITVVDRLWSKCHI